MWACIKCGWAFVLDDVQKDYGDGDCLCVGCFHRRQHDEHPMPAGLRRQVVSTLAAIA